MRSLVQGSGVVCVLAALAALVACDGFGSDDPAPGSPAAEDAGGPDGQPNVNGSAPPDSFVFGALAPVTLTQGGSTASVPVAITRGSQFAEPLVVTVKNLPAAITAAPLTITGTEGTLVLTLSGTIDQGAVAGVTLEGTVNARKVTAPLAVSVRGVPGDPDTTWGAAKGRADGVFGADGSFAGDFVDLVLADDDSVYGIGVCNAGGTERTCAFHLRADGSLDTGYGSGGLAVHTLVQPYAAAVTNDGRLVVAGGGALGAIARFDATGQPDATFGTGELGPGTLPFAGTGGLSGTNEQILGVSIRKSDGNLFVAWRNRVSGTGFYNAVMRLDAAGGIVPSFGVAGGARTAVAEWTGIRVRNDGSASAGSVMTARVGTNTSGFLQIRGDAGDADPSQAQGATAREKAVTNATNASAGLALAPDGTAVFPVSMNETAYYLRKVTATGDDAPGFGSSGLAGPFTLGADSSRIGGLAVQADGKIIVAVDYGPLNTGPVEIRRHTAAGVLDQDYASDGRVKLLVGAGDSRGRKVVVQKSGRILVSGESMGTPKRASVFAIWP